MRSLPQNVGPFFGRANGRSRPPASERIVTEMHIPPGKAHLMLPRAVQDAILLSLERMLEGGKN